MQKLRNKKRLTILVLIFALIFLTGGAFAIGQGFLDIQGTALVPVMMPDHDVRWVIANDFPDPGAESEATITNQGQTIEWTVDFTGVDLETLADGEDVWVSLSATVENTGTVSVEFYSISVLDWPANAVDLGLAINVDDSELVGETLDEGDTAFVEVTVMWTPDAMDADYIEELIEEDIEDAMVTFSIEFHFDPVP